MELIVLQSTTTSTTIECIVGGVDAHQLASGCHVLDLYFDGFGGGTNCLTWTWLSGVPLGNLIMWWW